MTPGIAPVHDVLSRIGTIESRFVNDRPEHLEVVQSEEFDAFGTVYQQALETRANTPTSSVVATHHHATPASSAFGSASFVGRAVPVGTAGTHGHAHTQATITSSDPAVVNAINGVAHSGTRPVGGYGSMPVPDHLRAFGNGTVPTGELTEIAQHGHRLTAPAAAAWDNVVAAAAADGFDLRITDSYRTYEQQVDLARRKGLYKDGGLAATPGTSNHGWGLAVDADVTDPAMYAWLRENGPRFGFVEAVPREPWHWEFRPHQV